MAANNINMKEKIEYKMHANFSRLASKRKDVRLLQNSFKAVYLNAFARPMTQDASIKSWIRPSGYDTGISVYNSLTNKKEPLILQHGRVVKWYSCGPTVYDHAHIGHASAYVRQDFIRRILEDLYGISVVLVMGVTDIDDKIIMRSFESDVPWKELTQKFERSFLTDMKKLNVLPPTLLTRVTDHIPHIIRFIQRIVDNGYAYVTPQGSVYFDLEHYKHYGQLYKFPEDLAEPAGESSEKRAKYDFALWKAAKPKEPFWESPWGIGRPGWHIECSTMASHVLGEQLDVHSGGVDLRFPHHENEIAQSNAHFCCQQWSNYWLHTGHLYLSNDAKMSKSLQNTISVPEILKQCTPDQFRILCLFRSYRQNIEFNDSILEKAIRTDVQVRSFLSRAQAYIRGSVDFSKPINDSVLYQRLEDTRQVFQAALADDFNTPKAMGSLVNLVHDTNKETGDISSGESYARSVPVIAAISSFLQKSCELLGMHFQNEVADKGGDVEQLKNIIDASVDFRKQVRQVAVANKDFAKTLSPEQRKVASQTSVRLYNCCDELRDRLAQNNVKLSDVTGETLWDFKETAPTPEKEE